MGRVLAGLVGPAVARARQLHTPSARTTRPHPLADHSTPRASKRKQKRPSDAALALLTFMAVHARDDDGHDAWASHSWKVYAAAIGRERDPATEAFSESDRTAVKRAIGELLAAGLLDCIVKAAPGVTARYRLVLTSPTWDTVRPPTGEDASTETWDTARPTTASESSAPPTPDVGHGTSATWDTARPARGTTRVPLIPEIPKDDISSREDEVTMGNTGSRNADTSAPADPDGLVARARASWAKVGTA